MTTPLNLRPALAQHLQQRLQAFRDGFRQNLAILGPHGSGKTFQLRQLTAQAQGAWLSIYCPLYRESCRSFLQRFLCSVLQAADLQPDAAAAMTDQPLERLLHHTEGTLPKTAAAMRLIDGLIRRRLYGEAFNRALDTVPLLTEDTGRPSVLILDEFLFLEDLGLGHAFHELGKRVMTWPSTLFVLSSSSTFRARTILRERLQLLFGQFELLTLGVLDDAPAASWVHQELKGVRGAAAVSPFLLRWLGTYPWYLALFLRRLKERAALSKTVLTPEALLLHAAWDVLGSPEGTLHQWCASRMEAVAQGRLGARAVDALIHIAQGGRTATEVGKRIGRAGLSNVLQVLVEHDLAQRNGMCWIVPDPVLRCWLSAILSAQRADTGRQGLELRSRFERYLRELWTRWSEADRLSFSEQVVHLFSQFADDTVSLDSKIGRLPKFERIKTERPTAPGADAYLIADGPGRRWCATIQEGPADERAIATFDAFCRTQTPRPSRKVVIMKSSMDQNAKLLAKAANMWVWEAEELGALMRLYGSF